MPAALELLKDLRAVSQAGADTAMAACASVICEAREGRNPAGILAETLRAQVIERQLHGAELQAFLEGFCDTLQKYVEAQGLGRPTISEALR